MQREECKHARPDNESTKCEQEVRPAMECYPCNGSIAMKIDHQRKRAVVSISHQHSHPKPTHRAYKSAGQVKRPQNLDIIPMCFTTPKKKCNGIKTNR